MFADEDAQADGAGAGFLEGFDLAEADLGVELVALVDDGFGVGGSGFEGSGEKSEELVLAVRLAAFEPRPEAIKTRSPTAREPDSLRVSTWPRRTRVENSSPS